MISFKVIKNLISKEDCEHIVRDFENKKLITSTGLKMNVMGPHQNYYELESSVLLQHQLTPFISKEFEKNLKITYCYTRKYKKNSILINHIDRNSCEYSITIHLKSSDQTVNWPLYLMDGNKKVFINLNQGDCLLYKGIEVPHGREGGCPIDYYIQLFMHWVDSDGKYANYINDRYIREKKNAIER